MQVSCYPSYDVIIDDDDERIHAYCPALKGLHVDGDTVQDALKNATDALHAYVDSLIKHGDPLPAGCIVEQPSIALPTSSQAMLV